MFYSYKNCRVQINDIDYYAQAASLSEQGNVESSYNITSKNSNSYVANDGIGGSFNISYLLTGQDGLVKYLSLDDEPIQVNFGGMFFKSGFLRRYNFTLQPDTPLIVNAEIAFFDSISGQFSPYYESGNEIQCLNSAEATVTNFPGSDTANSNYITKLNYNYDANIAPQYVIGKTIPTRIVFGERVITAEITSEQINPFLMVSGNVANVRIKLKHPTNNSIYQNIDVNGVVYQKTYDTSQNSILSNSVVIKQTNLENFNLNNKSNTKKTKIYNFFPQSGYYGTNVTVSGDNLNYVNYISFEDKVFTNFITINNSQINVNVPFGAISGPLKLYTASDTVESSDLFFVGGLPIQIYGISSMTGANNDHVLVSGVNFYEISHVYFGSGVQTSEFTVLDNNTIDVKVPYNAEIGSIILKSELFNLSGTNSGIFVPSPSINGFSPVSGVTGDIIVLSGQSFNSVTGVKINNLPAQGTAVFSIVNNTGISITIPSGNTDGIIKLYSYSGITTTSADHFYPYSYITGITPISGRTGVFIEVSGKNFLPELLYNLGTNNYVVGFYGNVTGYFSLQSSNTVLYGQVPYGAKSGKISIYSPSLEEYPSNFSFNVRDNEPAITLISPISGKRGDITSIIGNDLYNFTNIILTGTNTGYIFDLNNITQSITKNFVNLTIPTISGGRYDIIATTIEGNATGSGIYILENPYVSGISTTSGSYATNITLTGINIYPEITQIWIDQSGYQAIIDSGSWDYNNNTIKFNLPSNTSSGNHNIIVYNTVTSGSGSQLFKYIPSPILRSFTPETGQWGDKIVVSGDYFDLVNNISIDNISGISYSIISSTGVELYIPNNSYSNYIKFYNQFNNSSSLTQIRITPPLARFSGISSNETYFNSGLIISGNYLDTVKQIGFSGVTGGIVFIDQMTGVNNTGLYFTVPYGISSGYVLLINSKGNTYSSQMLNIIPSARINSINIQTGVFQSSVLISGQYLSGSLVYLNAPENLIKIADNINRINDTGISFTISKEVIAGQVIVVGRNDSPVNYSGSITVLPTISGISGTLSYSTGGYITITGINAYDVTGYIGISGNNGCIYNIANYNEYTGKYLTGYTAITSRINSNFAGTGKLFIASSKDTSINNGISGSVTHSLLNNVIYNTPITISQPTPTINNISPTGGTNTTLVTISGTNLLSTLNIYFNTNGNSSAGTIYSINNTEVKVYPPTMASGTGLVYLTTPFGTASSGAFKVYPRLYISGYAPLSAHTGEYIRITGSGLLSVTGVNFGGTNASFIGIYESNTYILSGIVPTYFDCCPTTMQICVVNEGESYCL